MNGLETLTMLEEGRKVKELLERAKVQTSSLDSLDNLKDVADKAAEYSLEFTADAIYLSSKFGHDKACALLDISKEELKTILENAKDD